MRDVAGHNGPRTLAPGEEWKRQIRINLREDFALAARRDISDPVLAPLKAVLDRYNATVKNQFDAFAGYCREAEDYDKGAVNAVLRFLKMRKSATDSTLYRWTKDTIEQPGKEQQYATRFTIYASGGQEVYDKAVADALEADLQPLKESGMVTKISNISADPARNPQAPAKFQR